MTKTYTTVEMIEQLTAVNTINASEQQRRLFREALNNLVTIAKTEKFLEIRRGLSPTLGSAQDK